MVSLHGQDKIYIYPYVFPLFVDLEGSKAGGTKSAMKRLIFWPADWHFDVIIIGCAVVQLLPCRYI